MEERVRALNSQPIRTDAEYVLYWSQMNRRVEQNHALVYAAEMANRLGKPLLVYEGLTYTYRQANDRMHTFVLEGVPDTAQRLKKIGAGYIFYLRRTQDSDNDILYRLAKDAAAIVTDDYPVFIAAEHNARVSKKIGVAYHVVDSSCIIPMSRMEKREYAAYTIRPKVKKLLPQYLGPVELPKLDHKFKGKIPSYHVEVTRTNIQELVASCQIDHTVKPSISYTGGYCQAERMLNHFLQEKFHRYAEDRNDPARHGTSDLSPHLHFGHISSLQIALTVKRYAEERGATAEEYLEELIVRRELAFNFARHVERVDSLNNLPNWARETLLKHAKDKRDPIYEMEELEEARTHDDIWNAAQKELLIRGKIHGYYRMYWGKKVLEWSPTCQDALERLLYLHDRYALDGRDPNTYTNVLWLFGMHDRPWNERPIFGMVRYMSYDGMKRKTDTAGYLQEIAYLERTGKDPHRLA